MMACCHRALITANVIHIFYTITSAAPAASLWCYIATWLLEMYSWKCTQCRGNMSTITLHITLTSPECTVCCPL